MQDMQDTTHVCMYVCGCVYYLSEVVICQIHNLLGCSRTLDGQWGHCENSIASLVVANQLEGFLRIF